MKTKMFRLILIAALTIAAVPASAAERTVAEQVARMTLGRKITVELNTGETLKGRMGPVSADQFNLEPRRQGQGTTRSVRFDEVRSVRSGLSGGQKWALGVGIGVGGFLALIAALASVVGG